MCLSGTYVHLPNFDLLARPARVLEVFNILNFLKVQIPLAQSLLKEKICFGDHRTQDPYRYECIKPRFDIS